jgi:hypothetical protein
MNMHNCAVRILYCIQYYKVPINPSFFSPFLSSLVFFFSSQFMMSAHRFPGRWFSTLLVVSSILGKSTWRPHNLCHEISDFVHAPLRFHKISIERVVFTSFSSALLRDVCKLD